MTDATITLAISTARRIVMAVQGPHPRVPDALRATIDVRMTRAMRVLWGELPLDEGMTLEGVVAQVAVTRLIVEGPQNDL